MHAVYKLSFTHHRTLLSQDHFLAVPPASGTTSAFSILPVHMDRDTNGPLRGGRPVSVTRPQLGSSQESELAEARNLL